MSIKRPAIEEHIEIARDLCELEISLRRVLEHSGYFYACETDALLQTIDVLRRLRARLESAMLESHLQLDNRWLNLYRDNDCASAIETGSDSESDTGTVS